MHVIGKTLSEFTELRRIGHQPAQLHMVAMGINDRKTVFSGQFDDQGTKCQKAAALVDDGSIELLLRQIGEGAADLRFAHGRSEIHNKRDTEMLPCFAIQRSRRVVPHARLQGGDLGSRRHHLFEDLQALFRRFLLQLRM